MGPSIIGSSLGHHSWPLLQMERDHFFYHSLSPNYNHGFPEFGIGREPEENIPL